MPKVTVVMPVHNGERYLNVALESVLSQHFRDWELVVVDDGSTDGTPHILKRYADDRIVVIRQDNAGEARARNVGLAHARGEYIAFLDADDVYLPGALGDLAGFLESHPEFDVVYADGYFCDACEKILGRLSEIRACTPSGHILDRLVLEPIGIVPTVTMTRRSVVTAHEILFDESLVIGPDWDFWIQLARHARFGNLDKVTGKYRVHETNITRTSGLNRRLEDQVYIRMKVLQSEWFPELSEATRQRFFHGLLTSPLAGQPTRQRVILESAQLQRLPARDQARLWRHVGVDYLLKRSEQSFAANCLRIAVRIWPGDFRSRGLLFTLRFGSQVPAFLLRLWRTVNKTLHHVGSFRHHRPKPVPAELGPVGD